MWTTYYYPGGKDREYTWISGGECTVIVGELLRDTAWCHPKPFISGLVENQKLMESLQLYVHSNLRHLGCKVLDQGPLSCIEVYYKPSAPLKCHCLLFGTWLHSLPSTRPGAIERYLHATAEITKYAKYRISCRVLFTRAVHLEACFGGQQCIMPAIQCR